MPSRMLPTRLVQVAVILGSSDAGPVFSLSSLSSAFAIPSGEVSVLTQGSQP